jgi:hypothetical protein
MNQSVSPDRRFLLKVLATSALVAVACCGGATLPGNPDDSRPPSPTAATSSVVATVVSLSAAPATRPSANRSSATPKPAPRPSSPRAGPTSPESQQPAGCHPNYSGCVPIASDVDCAGGSGNGPQYVQGPVDVLGPDVYDLDRDGDGVGCE